MNVLLFPQSFRDTVANNHDNKRPTTKIHEKKVNEDVTLNSLCWIKKKKKKYETQKITLEFSQPVNERPFRYLDISRTRKSI